jgi:CheY-like chemotaxis protein
MWQRLGRSDQDRASGYRTTDQQLKPASKCLLFCRSLVIADIVLRFIESGEEVAVEEVGKRILVVDDNRDGADTMATILRLLGNEVEAAYSGMQSIETAERFRPDIILMDVGMPRMSGLESARMILGMPWGKSIKIVSISGLGLEEDHRRSQSAGCTAHLVKPVNLEEIKSLISHCNGR